MRNRRFPKYPDDTDYTTNSPSYYDDLARKNKLIRLLAEKIWEYEETLDLTLEEINQRLTDYINENDELMKQRLEEWDLRLEEFPENVELLLQEWLSDGTLDHIINETIFSWKADKEYVDNEFEKVNKNVDFLSEESARRVKSINQSDFSTNFINDTLTDVGIVKRNNEQIELFAQNDYEGFYYTLQKDPNDDFFKLGSGGYYSNESNIEVVTNGSGWVKDSQPNWYTTNIGDSFTIEYEGTGIDITHLMDYRGGLWEFKLDNEIRTYTTFNKDSTEEKVIKFKHDFGKKKITGVFIGNDKKSNYDTPRGWLQKDVTVYGTLERNDVLEILHPTSNKEFAFTLKYQNESSIWHPEHSGNGSLFNNSFRVLADEKVINFEKQPLNTPILGKHISIQQRIEGFNNNQEIVLAKYRIKYDLSLSGIINYKGYLIAQEPFTLNTGYPLMLPVKSDVLNTVVTSQGNTKVNTGDESNYYFKNENGESKSVLFTTDISGYGSYVAFASLDNAVESMRYGEEGTPPRDEAVFFWQRPTLPKFYFQAFDRKEFKPNDVYKWSGKIGIGKKDQLAFFI